AENLVAALAARFAIMVRQFVTLGHAFQKVLVADAAFASENFRHLHGVVRGRHVIFGGPLLVRLALTGHEAPLRLLANCRQLGHFANVSKNPRNELATRLKSHLPMPCSAVSTGASFPSDFERSRTKGSPPWPAMTTRHAGQSSMGCCSNGLKE